MNDDRQGNRLKDFDGQAAEVRTEGQKVKMWRSRLNRQMEALQLGERKKSADRGMDYLCGRVEAKNGQQIYLNYLYPTLSDVFRKTLPESPVPRCEAHDERTEAFERFAQELLNVSMSAESGRVTRVADELQFDDALWGIGIAKTVWRVDEEPASPAMVQDLEQLAIEVDRAEKENLDPLSAEVVDADLDTAHLETHAEALAIWQQDPQQDQALRMHMQEHQARLVSIRREWPELVRVSPERFLYDTEVPWPKRAWEAELRIERIEDLLNMGCKNLNETNIGPPTLKDYQSDMEPREDMTVRVWDIHDRRKNERVVISADGPEDGRMLKKEEWVYGAVDIYQRFISREVGPDAYNGYPLVAACAPILDELSFVDFHNRRHVRNHSDYKTYLPKGTDPAVKRDQNDDNKKYVELDPQLYAMGGPKPYSPPALPSSNMDYRALLLGELRRQAGSDAQDAGAPNPHQVTATESQNRAESHDQRKMERQEAMSRFLSLVGKNFLALYNRFGTKALLVRIMGEMGPEYKAFAPTDIPDEMDVYVDVSTQTDEGRASRIMAMRGFIELAMSLGVPLDAQRLVEQYGRLSGLARPEQYRLPVPQGQANQLPGQASMPADGSTTQVLQFPQGQQPQMEGMVS